LSIDGEVLNDDTATAFGVVVSTVLAFGDDDKLNNGTLVSFLFRGVTVLESDSAMFTVESRSVISQYCPTCLSVFLASVRDVKRSESVGAGMKFVTIGEESLAFVEFLDWLSAETNATTDLLASTVLALRSTDFAESSIFSESTHFTLCSVTETFKFACCSIVFGVLNPDKPRGGCGFSNFGVSGKNSTGELSVNTVEDDDNAIVLAERSGLAEEGESSGERIPDEWPTVVAFKTDTVVRSNEHGLVPPVCFK